MPLHSLWAIYASAVSNRFPALVNAGFAVINSSKKIGLRGA